MFCSIFYSKRSFLLLAAVALVMLAARLPAAQAQMAHQREDTPLQKNATVGRYLYLGDVPRFEAQNLELYVSKVGLTLRVKAWVPEEMPNHYRAFLLAKWKYLHDAFMSPSFHLDTLRSPELEATTRTKLPASDRAWLLMISQYMHHVLEGRGEVLYSDAATTGAENPSDGDSYKRAVLTALLRSYLRDDHLAIEDGLKLAQAALSERPDDTAAAQASHALFQAHLGDNYFADPSHGKGVSGYLTFVYPIAATTDGPFNIPAEGALKIGSPASMESRWWSDKWQDEFGGFPFLLITDDGVAFHGPISNRAGLDVWYLRRDYVSHGCMRMEPSDLLELRSLLPGDFPKLQARKQGVRIQIMEWPDVTTLGGPLEAMDVAYYEVPGWIGVTGIASKKGAPKRTAAEQAVAMQAALESAVSQSLAVNLVTQFRKRHYVRYNGLLPSHNRFDLTEGKFYGIPRYEMQGSTLKRVGTLDAVPVRTFPHRGNRIIQYREDGVPLRGFEDSAGKFPPKFFNYP